MGFMEVPHGRKTRPRFAERIPRAWPSGGDAIHSRRQKGYEGAASKIASIWPGKSSRRRRLAHDCIWPVRPPGSMCAPCSAGSLAEGWSWAIGGGY